jgi:hypothetical protein
MSAMASGGIDPRAHGNKTHCAEVLSPALTPRTQPEAGDLRTHRQLPQATVLLIAERVDGFFLERLTEGGELVGTTRHDTMDEAMDQAYSEYDAISDWRLCPDGADPLKYLHGQSEL